MTDYSNRTQAEFEHRKDEAMAEQNERIAAYEKRRRCEIVGMWLQRSFDEYDAENEQEGYRYLLEALRVAEGSDLRGSVAHPPDKPAGGTQSRS